MAEMMVESPTLRRLHPIRQLIFLYFFSVSYFYDPNC
jgi:hypothetical protein